jgi:hypothetical protein
VQFVIYAGRKEATSTGSQKSKTKYQSFGAASRAVLKSIAEGDSVILHFDFWSLHFSRDSAGRFGAWPERNFLSVLIQDREERK